MIIMKIKSLFLIKQKILYKIKCIALKVFHIIIINFLINVSQFQKYESESAK